MATGQPRRRQLGLAKPHVGVALLCIALFVFTGLFLWNTYRVAVAEGGRSARVLARLLADETEAALAAPLGALDQLAVAVATAGRPPNADPTELRRLAGLIATRYGMVKQLLVLDAEGRVRHRLGEGARGPRVGDPAPFRLPAPDPGRVLLVPEIGGADPFRIYLVRVLAESEGGGTVAVGIGPEMLTTFHQALEYGEGAVVALVEAEHRALLARVPAIQGTLGRPLPPEGPMTQALASGRLNQELHVRSAIDGVLRVVVTQSLGTVPAVVVVGLPYSAILQFWYHQTVIATVLTCCLIGAGIVVARRSGALERTADALRESENRFRVLFDRNPQPMWVYDPETRRFLEVNRRAVDVYGYSRDEFLSMVISDLMAPEDHSRLASAMVDRRNAGYITTEWRLRCRSGRWIDVLSTSHDIEFVGRRCVLAAAVDVTAWRHAEAQLLQAQKMEAIGLLTGGIAHDFNNLLTVIIGNAEKLQNRVAQGSLDQQLAEMIRLAGDRAAHLTNDLLAVARRQPLRPVVVDLTTLVNDMTELIRRTIGEDVELNVRLSPTLWPVFLDRAQLESALLNLAINARDAMPKGGVLTIETANLTVDDAYVEMNPGLQAGDYVTLSVSDTGIGMTADIAERAFEPFFTTKSRGKGTGLGLAMVFGFVKQSHGHIRLYSEPDRGTTLRLYLPRDRSGHRPAEPEAADASIAMGAGERLLLVEDDAMVRRFTLGLLREIGYQVEEAEHGRAAIERLRGNMPCDLLVTDVVMPGGISGRELGEQAMRLRPGIKVLYISGYTQNAILSHGRVEPGLHLLSKPFTRAQLSQAVRRALGVVAAESAATP